MKTQLFAEDQAPSDVMAAILRSGPTELADLHPSDRGPLGIGKLRMVGVYDDRFKDTFMMRVRIPGGRLNADQLDAIVGVVNDFCVRSPGHSDPDRFAEITTRQDLQIHWIRFENLPEIWARFGAVGVGSVESCGNTLRNVTACAVDGVDGRGLLEVGPVVEAIEALMGSDERLTAFLPRKFKVAVTGCPTDCVVARVNCVAFTPARRAGRVGFGVHVGGGLSDYPRLATALDMFIEPAVAPKVVAALLDLFRAEGDYEHSSVNRFRALVHRLGPVRIASELRARVPDGSLEPRGEDLSTWETADHLGVNTDKFGTSYVGLSVPVGRVGVDDLREISRLARLHGDGNVRLTQRQSLVLTGVSDTARLLAEPLLERFRPEPDPFERAVVACTSAPFCKFAILPMKTYGTQLTEHLRRNVPVGGWDRLEGLRIHMSGCKASCAQIPLAHIGLRATMGKTDTQIFDAFDVAVGGDSGAGRLGSWACLGAPASTTFDAITSALVEVASGEASLGSLDARDFGDVLDRVDATSGSQR
ncbi:MAG: hypothetical protein U0990_04310 [Candidatus Nanopelagicales bacterium]|nr:hypothetical protein [Candidatus Nanopelagicales bacterium]MDZ4249294.1 hypothetical protein [Candidatus Nanopelagicales bacterium]